MLAQFYGESPDQPTRIEVRQASYRPIFTSRDQVAERLRSSTIGAPSSGPGVAVLRFAATLPPGTRFCWLREEVTSEVFRYREFRFVDASGLPRHRARQRALGLGNRLL